MTEFTRRAEPGMPAPSVIGMKRGSHLRFTGRPG
jgi:hypothetical protein